MNQTNCRCNVLCLKNRQLLKRSLQKPVSRAELDALERKVAQHEAANRSPSGDRYAHLRARQMPTG